MRHTVLALSSVVAVISTNTTMAFAQSSGGVFSNGRAYLILGIVLLITCAIVAYYMHFRLYVARANRHGVEEFSGAGDYMRQGLKRFATGIVLVVWMLAAIAMIFVGIAS